MERKKIDIRKVFANEGQIEGLPRNPRTIRKDKFRKLVKSIRELPEMTEARDLLVVPRGEGYVVIGGNMRLQAYRELGWKEVPCCILPHDTPSEKLRQMLIQDNNPFGDNDWDALANEWDAAELDDWGFDDEPAPAPRRAPRQAAAPAPVESAPVDPFASMDFDFTKQNLSPSAPTSASAPAAKKDAFDDLFSL